MTESQFEQLANLLPPTLTKADISNLIAALPKSVYPYKQVMKGSAILENKLVDEKDEKEIDPDVLYNGTSYRKLNHKRRINRAYKKQGVAGVKNYLRWFKKHHIKLIKTMPDQFKQFNESGKLVAIEV